MTKEELAELKRLEAAATEHPAPVLAWTTCRTRQEIQFRNALRNHARDLIAAAERCAELEAALQAIATAKQEWVTGVGSYGGGETNAGFASRLQRMAAAAGGGA